MLQYLHEKMHYFLFFHNQAIKVNDTEVLFFSRYIVDVGKSFIWNIIFEGRSHWNEQWNVGILYEYFHYIMMSFMIKET